MANGKIYGLAVVGIGVSSDSKVPAMSVVLRVKSIVRLRAH